MLNKFFEWIERNDTRAFIFSWLILFPLGIVFGFLCSLYLVKIVLGVTTKALVQ
jgi:hypothetical protein